MTKYFFYILFYILLLGGILIHSCNGQVNTSSTKEAANASKPSPEVIGTPPPLVSDHNPYNDSNLVSQYIRSIFQDSKGNFWFGPAGQSVARYDEKTLKYYSKIEFFYGNKSVDRDYGNSVHAITEDKNGNIWFGTDHGAIKYDGKNFRSYTEKDGLSNTRVGRKSILVEKSGDIWVGTQGGVFRYIPSADSTGGQCFSLMHLLPPVNVKGIMEDNAGNIWFASQNNGVFRYDGKAIKNITEKEGLSDNAAGGIAQDKMGNMWFTMKGGICRYDGENFTSYTTEDGIGGSEVWGIFIEQSGLIWITARGSTTRFEPSIPISNPKAFTVFTVEDGLNCCVQSMYQDRSGNMWWGTGQGLYRFDGKRFYQVKQKGPW
ncbi:MAG: two-component regulator propeller domain-containing protein [Bacteroidota bacterium]